VSTSEKLDISPWVDIAPIRRIEQSNNSRFLIYRLVADGVFIIKKLAFSGPDDDDEEEEEEFVFDSQNGDNMFFTEAVPRKWDLQTKEDSKHFTVSAASSTGSTVVELGFSETPPNAHLGSCC
jgi:hypothetical protein